MHRTQAVSASTPELSGLPAAFGCSLVNGDPDSACVHVAGELDIATSPELDLVLREALLVARLVVLDLRDVEFIDSSGVHAIVTASNRARTTARRLVILRAPAHVDRIFKLTRTFGRLEFASTDSLGSVCAEASRRWRSNPLRSPLALRAL